MNELVIGFLFGFGGFFGVLVGIFLFIVMTGFCTLGYWQKG